MKRLRDGLLLVFCLLAAGCGSRKATTEADVLAVLNQPRTADEQAQWVAQGQRLFWNRSCQNCHVLQGTPRDAPKLTQLYSSPAILQGGETVDRDWAYLARSILDPRAQVVAGYNQPMSNYRFLSAQDVAALISFLDTHSSKPAPGTLAPAESAKPDPAQSDPVN